MADPHSKLLGQNSGDYFQILKWASLVNSEFLPALSKVFPPLLGMAPYNKKLVDENYEYSNKVASLLEERLQNHTYLVGERLTFADVLCANLFLRGFEHMYGVEWRKQHPGITRWFKTVIAHPILSSFIGDFKFREKPLEYTPPKKEKKQQPQQQQSKPAPAPSAAASNPPPKPKHPLAELGPSKQPIDAWKRLYSNEETREVAIPWFWENMYDPSEWSLWKVDYRYNDELTLTFMSNNLIGGFFARLSASQKFMFGSMVVYGENNNNGITGFFLVRGQEYAPAFDVAPDWESYNFTKIDPSDPATKDFIENMLAWDKPVLVNGEAREISDGKVFK